MATDAQPSRAPDRHLAPCPKSPNCVSTRGGAPGQRMSPIPYRVPTATARRLLLEILGSRKRTEIVTAEELYLHATETSALFRFVDDVELSLDEAAREIHFRSASRTGYSDLGVNRRRMEAIRAEYLRREAEI